MSTQSILKEFDEKFVYWVVLGSTLYDGSERRWKKERQQPQEIISFLEQAIKDAKEEERKKLIDKLSLIEGFTQIKERYGKAKDLIDMWGGETERERKKREFIKNEIKILQKRIDELPEMIGGVDGENYELWNNVIKYLKKELKGK